MPGGISPRAPHEKRAFSGQTLNNRAAGIAGLSAAATLAPAARGQASSDANPDLEQIRALLRAHDEAFTNQDLTGVMACLAEKAVLMGTGPGEVWSGPEEIKVAYEHFFQGFDKGEQAFEYQFRIGDVSATMGWLMASGNVSGKKDGKDLVYSKCQKSLPKWGPKTPRD